MISAPHSAGIKHVVGFSMCWAKQSRAAAASALQCTEASYAFMHWYVQSPASSWQCFATRSWQLVLQSAATPAPPAPGLAGEEPVAEWGASEPPPEPSTNTTFPPQLEAEKSDARARAPKVIRFTARSLTTIAIRTVCGFCGACLRYRARPEGS